jgi:hypothetical protein
MCSSVLREKFRIMNSDQPRPLLFILLGSNNFIPESRREHGCLSVVSVVCCQVEFSVTSWSLVQRSPTDCGVSCVI